MQLERRSFLAGASSALLAALSFGVTAPLIALETKRAGSSTIASLLYAGAAASSLLSRGRASEGRALGRLDLGRVLVVALLGGALAPTLLVWGLKRVGGLTGSLLLNLEAAFTVLLAWLVYHEPIGRRVRAALGLMTLGGAVLAAGTSGGAGFSGLGALAVTGATLGWALDNTLSRSLAELSPLSVVGLKGLFGASLTATLAYVLHEPLPSARTCLFLLACGASGYGLSLRLYLRAQRRIGAARTGSIFAVAPFIGASFGFMLGDRAHAGLAALSALCFGLGLWLHLTEGHRHAHRHASLDHDHPHRHDDGHHDHAHDPPIVGEHSHPHHHDALEHEHEHAPDVHHDHRHS